MTSDVESWKKSTYVRSFIHWKSYKRAQNVPTALESFYQLQAFEKAQAPWSKRKEKILKYKKIIETHTTHAETLRRQTAASGDTSKARSMLEKVCCWHVLTKGGDRAGKVQDQNAPSGGGHDPLPRSLPPRRACRYSLVIMIR
jgi:hypothetical protein